MDPVNTGHEASKHRNWVKLSHWIVTVSFLALTVTGFEMIMVHPRFYWGEAGNDLTPALFEVPVSRNYHHGGYSSSTPFFVKPESPVSASRTYDIFNQNGWGRSLHFLSGWFLTLTGLLYLLAGTFTGHFRRHLWPQLWSLKHLKEDMRRHWKWDIPATSGGPDYGFLQRLSYLGVIFVLMPLIAMTGMTMSPAITAEHGWLLKLFLGAQSARTIHFMVSVALELFLAVHLVMIVKSGFRKQVRSMTL